MNSKGIINPSKEEQLRQFLNDLKKAGKFRAVLLARRNGDLISSVFDEHLSVVDGLELSSMCASVLEGANNLRKVTGQDAIDKIIAELDSYLLIVIQCDDNVFLTFIADFSSHVAKILESIDEYQKKIMFLY